MHITAFTWNLNNSSEVQIPQISKETEILLICLQESFSSPVLFFKGDFKEKYSEIFHKEIGGLRTLIFSKNNKNIKNNKKEVKCFSYALGKYFLINKGAHSIEIYDENGCHFNFINLHLIHSDFAIKDRADSINLINQKQKIILGDFNFRNKNEENIFDENYAEISGDFFTYKYFLNSEKINEMKKFKTDRVFFLKNELKLVKYQFLNTREYFLSDHRPLFCSFVVSKNFRNYFKENSDFYVLIHNINANIQHKIYKMTSSKYFLIILIFIVFFYMRKNF